MTAELFSLEIRGIAHSIAYSMANALMFASIQSYYSLKSTFGGVYGVQWFFTVVSLAGGVYAFIFLPETHKKKFKDIHDYFNHNTVFLGQKKKTPKSLVNKPIVKNTRVAQKDVIVAPKQNENLLKVEV